MCGTINPFTVRGAPCALKPHLNGNANRKTLGFISQYGCQSSFLDWVKTFRRHALDIEEEELLMCPMLWCRHTFKDADATVNHVFHCSRLSNGWYWCPYCKRPERFLECDKGCDIVPKPRLQKRDKKLNFTFLKWFGPRRSSKKTRADTGYAEWVNEKAKCPENWPDTAEIAAGVVLRSELPASQRANVRSRYEMFSPTHSDTPEGRRDSINSMELYSQALVTPPPVYSFDPPPTNLELPSPNPVYWMTELRDRASCNAYPMASPVTLQDQQPDSSVGTSDQGAEVQGKSSTKDIPFLDETLAYNQLHGPYEEYAVTQSDWQFLGQDFPALQTAQLCTPNPNSSSQLSSALSPGSQASTLMSPMSAVGPPTSRTQEVPGISGITNTEASISAATLQSSTFPPTNLEETHLQSRLARSGANTASASDPPRYCWYLNSEYRQMAFGFQNLGAEATNSHGPQLDGHPAKRRIQVEQLQELVCTVNKMWMEGSLPRDLHERCSSLSVSTLFARGINTLETWFRGKLERTFEDVFSFMHIAVAFALILHHDDNSYCWDVFFQDALQLQNALVDKEQKVLFVTAIKCWPRLPDQQSPSFNATPHPSITRNASQEFLIGNDQAALLQSLRGSEVFKVCAGFLDGFEDAYNMESNMSFPNAAKAAQTYLPWIGELIEKIIRPLEQTKGIEAFQANLNCASLGIWGGTLRKVREVEVALVSSARRSSQSLEVFERFRNHLSTQCNKFLRSIDGKWRDQYYIANLIDIMDISGQLERDPGSNLASGIDPSVLGVSRTIGLSLDSPSSLSSTSTGVFTVDSSPTSLRTRMSVDTSQDDELGTRMTSPTTASQPSISPTSPAFNTSTSHVEIPCPECGEKFSGRPADAKKNLKRHLETSPKHNEHPGVKCPEPGCTAKRKRSDNLRSHLSRKHGLTSPELDQAVKKSKGMNAVAENA